jgi:hypothetical protein
MAHCTKQRPTRLPEAELRELVEHQKLSDVAIGKQLGVDPKTIWNWRKVYGIPPAYAATASKAHKQQRPRRCRGCEIKLEREQALCSECLAEALVEWLVALGNSFPAPNLRACVSYTERHEWREEFRELFGVAEQGRDYFQMVPVKESLDASPGLHFSHIARLIG